MVKSKQLLVHSTPFILGIILSYFFWRSNAMLFMLYMAIVLIVISLGKDKKVEARILVYGIVAGIIIEVLGTKISGYQSFTSPDVFGIPYWLPISWGYGFILMKRIGLIIGTGSPWTKI